MNFLDFSRFFLEFILNFTDFNSLKQSQKRGLISRRNRWLIWHGMGLCGCDMARKATWQHHEEPHEHLCGADVARTHGRATPVHADAWVAPTWHEGLRAGHMAEQCASDEIAWIKKHQSGKLQSTPSPSSTRPLKDT